MMPVGPKPTQKERGSGKCNCIHSKRVALALKQKNHAVICIVASIILTLIFLVLITMWAVTRAPLTISKESSACIPCDKMEHNSNENQDAEAAGIKRRDDGICCGPVETIAQILFQKEMAVQYYYSSSSRSLIDMAEVYADCERETNDKQPMAKVVGIKEFTASYIVDGHNKILWNKNGRTFYANNCIHLELEGEIFIRKAGYYIVSSQLNLRRRTETSIPMNETRPTTFSHHVDLLSHKYGTNGVLMQTKKSIATNGVYFTSFLSAVFKLNKYDRLSVSVSHPELLDINNPNDHFLVYYTYDLPN
ncbi:uncharacterized protein LOC128224026 [Mya arenaria]|uniref:uncharacterized protein LOC128224026 n=1 Tax=Mya arenaria TaxID=6604 RepID=UPI0022E3D1C2|nr:uncharacterized protein LOC128224026 [Mya arenaria]